MAIDDEVTLLQSVLTNENALVSCGRLSATDFESSQKRVADLTDAIVALVKPWAKRGGDREATADRLATLYKKLVGDPADPEFRARIEADQQRALAEEQQVPVETDDDRIERLMREREEQRTGAYRRQGRW